MARPEYDSPAAKQARWVFHTLECIRAGEVVSPDDVANHLAPQFVDAGWDGKRMLGVYREAAPLASHIESLQTEFERGESISLLATLGDGRRYRWEFTVEAAPPHRLSGQLWTGPLTARYVDHVVKGRDADVLVRDYNNTEAGPQLLLLHCAGAHVGGSWDMVVPHITRPAGIHAIDLRGHGRADPCHPYSTVGSVADIHTATGETSPQDLILVGHSLGGHVALEYAARTPCRGLVTLDGPAGLSFDAPDEDIAAAPEPMKAILTDLITQDVAGLIRDLASPALFVLCRGGNDWEPEWIDQRRQLADYATRHGHQVRWIDVADHNFGWSMPELTGGLINDFLATLG